MKIKPFELERYFAKYEFSAPYMLSSSDCEPLTLKEVLALADKDSLKLWENLWLGYTESQGHPLLREEVAKLYENISPESVLEIVPEEGILIAMNVLLEKGDHVISTFPGYQTLYGIAESLGCSITKWLPEVRDNRWKFDIEFIRNSILKNTKLIVVNFPHNPTGALLSKEEFNEILDLAKKNNTFVFSDEISRFLEYEESPRLPPAGKDYTTICGSAPSEILGIIALRSKETIIRRNLEIIQSNVKLLDEFFGRYSNVFSWCKPDAGSIAFPELKIGKLKVYDFCQNLVKEKGVMLLPSKVYDYKGNNFRIGFGRGNMPKALSLLEGYVLENYK